jgi:hypothetical protein
MVIPEIKNLLPKLEVEIHKRYNFKRDYYLNKNGKKVYISNGIFQKNKKLVAWAETRTGFDDEVEVKVYHLGSINKLKANWKISPIDGSCNICYMKFYEDELVIVWRDDNYHIIRIELSKEKIETNVKMIRLRPLIHFDGKTIFSQYYQGQSDDRSIQRIQIPKLEYLKSITAEDARKIGIQLSETWEY